MTGSAVIEGRTDAITAFAPVMRPRVLRRLAQAARHRIALIIAPAGYGKSIALRQYLESVDGPCVRYDVQPEHATLLGFVRGFADALKAEVPHARQAVSGAYETAALSLTPGADLARWLLVHLQNFSGTIALDDLQVAQGDRQVIAFILQMVEDTRERVRWIFASRAVPDLPIGSWQAYGDLGLIVEEADLRFSDQEARAAADAEGGVLADEDLSNLLILTEGWPTALTFALRSATGAGDLRHAATLTREMMYRYLAEQVYASLDARQCEFLHVISYLAEIDLDVARRAGIAKPRLVLESLRDRVAFISPDSTGTYRCHDLFRDFLRYELELQGDEAVHAMKLRVALALDSAGKTVPALILFSEVRSEADILGILASDGFDLMERAHGDAVKRAVDALPRDVQTCHPVPLGMRALGEADAGRLDRARALFERAIANATSRTQAADLAARLAIVLYNKGDLGVSDLLAPFTTSEDILPGLQAECASLSAAALALRGMRGDATAMIAIAEQRMHHIDSASSRAKVLLRLSVACYHCGEVERAKDLAAQAATLSSESNMFSLAARAYSQLAFIAMAEDDDSEQLRYFADLAAQSAAKAGDMIAMQTALLHSLNAETRLGNVAEVQRLLRRPELTSMKDPYRASGLRWARALCAAWEGDFASAHALLSPVCGRFAHEAENIANRAFCALFFMADGRRVEAMSFVAAVAKSAVPVEPNGQHSRREGRIGAMVCALVNAMCRKGYNEKILTADQNEIGSEGVVAFGQAVKSLVGWLQNEENESETLRSIDRLDQCKYGGYARLLRSVVRSDCTKQRAPVLALTAAELLVVNCLANGQSPKKIAHDSGRSILTVRTHIKNLAHKLGCSGQDESIRVARECGLLLDGGDIG